MKAIGYLVVGLVLPTWAIMALLHVPMHGLPWWHYVLAGFLFAFINIMGEVEGRDKERNGR